MFGDTDRTFNESHSSQEILRTPSLISFNMTPPTASSTDTTHLIVLSRCVSTTSSPPLTLPHTTSDRSFTVYWGLNEAGRIPEVGADNRYLEVKNRYRQSVTELFQLLWAEQENIDVSNFVLRSLWNKNILITDLLNPGRASRADTWISVPTVLVNITQSTVHMERTAASIEVDELWLDPGASTFPNLKKGVQLCSEERMTLDSGSYNLWVMWPELSRCEKGKAIHTHTYTLIPLYCLRCK